MTETETETEKSHVLLIEWTSTNASLAHFLNHATMWIVLSPRTEQSYGTVICRKSPCHCSRLEVGFEIGDETSTSPCFHE